MKLKTLGFFVAVVAAVAVAAVMWSGDAVQVSHAKEAGSDAVALIGDTEITLGDLDAHAKRTNSKVYQDLFDARNRALNELIAEKMLLAEAELRGLTPEELVNQEIVQKTTPVSDPQVDAFYKSNSGRMGGRSLEEMKGQIEGYLTSENRLKARRAYIGGLRAKNKVTVMLEPPRADVQVASSDPKLGPDSAAVRIIEFSDFQ